MSSENNLEIASGNVRSLKSLLCSFHSSLPVSGYTHNFYRYPARFSPQFARAAIEHFTEPGDTVMDPFMGAGTAAVEALAGGRRFVGCDINPLATFVASVKTSFLTSAEIAGLLKWADTLPQFVNLRTPCTCDDSWSGYYRNVPWRVRKTLVSSLDSLTALGTERQRQFARCTLLKTAQWALDCRSEVPTKNDFLQMHRDNVTKMIEGCINFNETASKALRAPLSRIPRNRLILTRSAVGLQREGRISKAYLPPRLVLTSPPYPGVHILYHRWQVHGRRETPAPFWLAGRRNGNGAAHYTFGDRERKDTAWYWFQLRESFLSVVGMLDGRSVVVQLIAFSDPERQLPSYLHTLQSAGLVEVQIAGADGGALSRDVPNRKWYAEMQGRTASSREILLIHKKATTQPRARSSYVFRQLL